MADEIVTTSPAISARRAYAEILLVFVAIFGASIGLAAASLANNLPQISNLTWGEGASDAFGDVSTAAVIVTVAVLLCRRRGLSAAHLGYRMPVNARSLPAWTCCVRAAGWATLALVVGGYITTALATGKNNLHVLSGSGLLEGIGASINAGFVEETVALAFVVVTLQQAKRPFLEIGAVAVVLRMSYHIYYGPGVLGVAVWAAVFFLVFWQTRSLIALIAIHIAWDTFAFVGLVYGKFLGGVAVGLCVVLWFVALVLWRIDKRESVAAFGGAE